MDTLQEWRMRRVRLALRYLATACFLAITVLIAASIAPIVGSEISSILQRVLAVALTLTALLAVVHITKPRKDSSPPTST